MKYIANTSRIPIKFIDAKTENQLFEIKDRNWMNMGEIFTQNIASSLIEQEFKTKKKNPPDKILVLAVIELTREE
jgi:hypothetical protein